MGVFLIKQKFYFWKSEKVTIPYALSYTDALYNISVKYKMNHDLIEYEIRRSCSAKNFAINFAINSNKFEQYSWHALVPYQVAYLFEKGTTLHHTKEQERSRKQHTIWNS